MNSQEGTDDIRDALKKVKVYAATVKQGKDKTALKLSC